MVTEQLVLFFKILVINALFVAFNYLIGKVMLGKKSVFKSFEKDFVLKTLFGLIVLSIVNSIFHVGFKTINLVLLPLIIYVGYAFRTNENSETPSLSNKNVFVVLFFFTVSIVVTFLMLRGDLINGQKSPILDQSFYALASESIGKIGVESSYTINSIEGVNLKPIPYHYFEMWLANFVLNIFKVNPAFALLGIVNACFLFLFSTTVFVLVKKESSGFLNFAVSLLFGIVFINFRGFFHYFSGGEIFSDSVFFDGNQKFIYPLVFLFVSLMLYINNQKKIALIFLIMTTMVNIVFLPSIFGGVSLYFLYQLLLKKRGLQAILESKMLLACIFAFFLLFLNYMLFVVYSNHVSGMQKSLGGIFYNMLDNVIVWIKTQFIPLIIVIVLIVKINTSKYYQLAILVLLILITALLSRAFLDNNQNSYQLLSGITFAVNYLMVVLIVILSQKYLNSKSVYIKIILIVFSVFQFYENYPTINHLFVSKIYGHSSEYVSKINNLEITNGMGIKIINASKRTSLMNNPTYASISPYMSLTKFIKSAVVVNIDSLMPKSKGVFSNNLRNEFKFSSAFITTTNYQLNGSVMEWESSLNDYLMKNKPQFCIVDEGMKLPQTIEKYVINILEDSGTKETFYLLKIL